MKKKDEEMAVKVENTTQSFVTSLVGKIEKEFKKKPKDERVKKNTWYLLFSRETVEEIASSELKDQISGTVSKKEFLEVPS